jgi:UDP-N-acetylmuramate--L-alanine ligase/UDP-N-acetylenolpyruvoylglucosamine reductase
MIPLNGEETEEWLVSTPKSVVVYLVGIGGCGMSGLAHLLLDSGFTVYGSDLQANSEIHQLCERGAKTFVGHASDQLQSARPALVVYSSAIRMDNPEMAMAKKQGIPIVRRAVLLATLIKRRRGVCVAGMHGKTTTTALLTQTLNALGESPDYAIGAIVPQLGRNARMGDSVDNFFVVEADESDGTLREFHAEQAIVLNIDEEHLEYYANFEEVCEEFIAFAEQTTGVIFYCADDPRLMDLYASRNNTISYGFSPAADYRVEVESSKGFVIWDHKKRLGKFRILLFGEKNISNAVAVVAFLHQNGFQANEIASALATYYGANRRQQELFYDGHYRIFDDYGHHPMEIRATLQAIKEKCGGRLVVAFQPHRYSRTQYLLDEFSKCFEVADLLWVTEVYAASEDPIADVSGQRLVSEIKSGGQSVAYAATLKLLREKVRIAMRPGDVVVFMGAGDITHVAHQVALDLTMNDCSHVEAFQEMLSGDSNVIVNEQLASRTTLRVGGPADVLIEVACEPDLSQVLKYCAANNIPIFMLGRGSNLVIRDGGIRGVVIVLKNDALSRIEIKGRELFCGAGARLKHISNAARDAGLAGLEFLEGIPGCLGGALRMNAGAMGSEIFDVVERVRFMTHTGRIDERGSSGMKATYRSCPMLMNNIALGAVLHGEPSDFEAVRINMEKYRQRRTMSQPNASSAGCMFKNPDEKPAGKLVEECGLKGISVGGASVSDEHGNFFTNDGTASAADLIELLNLVRKRVREASGIDLELEVQIVGE